MCFRVKPKLEMELYLKITAGLLLFVQAFYLASLQDTTDSPGRTIDKSWLRELPKNIAGSQNATVNEEDATATDLSSGTSSGFMNIEEQNVTGHDPNNTYDDDLTGISNTTAPNDTTIQPPEFPATTASSTTTTSVSTDSSQINVTKAENSTVTPQTSSTPSIAKNSTTYPNLSNRTNLQSTTFAPQSNATQEPITKPDDTGLTNSTGSNSTTTATKTTTPQINRTSTTFSSTTVFPSESTETSTVTMTTTAVNTPVKANKTDKDAAWGNSSERGTASVLGVTFPYPENCFNVFSKATWLHFMDR